MLARLLTPGSKERAVSALCVAVGTVLLVAFLLREEGGPVDVAATTTTSVEAATRPTVLGEVLGADTTVPEAPPASAVLVTLDDEPSSTTTAGRPFVRPQGTPDPTIAPPVSVIRPPSRTTTTTTRPTTTTTAAPPTTTTTDPTTTTTPEPPAL
jgi:hypothetical protein